MFFVAASFFFAEKAQWQLEKTLFLAHTTHTYVDVHETREGVHPGTSPFGKQLPQVGGCCARKALRVHLQVATVELDGIENCIDEAIYQNVKKKNRGTLAPARTFIVALTRANKNRMSSRRPPWVTRPVASSKSFSTRYVAARKDIYLADGSDNKGTTFNAPTDTHGVRESMF